MQVDEGERTFTEDEIVQLKEHFKEAIDSNRRFEEIRTIEELYAVLEDRDAIGDDDIKRLEPKFQQFFQFQRKKNIACEKLVVPPNVVDLLRENCQHDWEELGLHLKLTREQLSQSQNVQDVVCRFSDNCNGISIQEMTFRLNRALEKCKKGYLKNRVTDLMLTKIS